MVIIGIIVFFGTLVIDLITDIRKWKLNQAVNHARGAALRSIGLIPAIWLLQWFSGPLVCSVYFMLFDGFYNIIRGFGWWFTGSNDADDAKTDDLLQALSTPMQATLKFSLILVSLVFYIAMLVK